MSGHRAERGGGRSRARGRLAQVGTVVALSVTLCLAWAASASGTAGAVVGQVFFREHGFSDGGPATEDFDIAGALGIIRGDSGAGGSSRPNAAVTRAEFAVMVARLLALDPFFEPPAPGGPTFSDAASIPPWAAPAVATCGALGIISGIPSPGGGSKFRPDDDVTGAEATAMLLRALGNAGNVTGGWPAGYIFRASETGLYSSDVATLTDWRLIGPLTPISRAQMAYLVHNALLCQRDYRPGEVGIPGTYSRAFIAGGLLSYITVGSADLMMRTVTAVDGRAYRLAAAVTGTPVREQGDLVGRRFLALANPQGQIVYLKRTSAETVVTGTVSSLAVRGGGASVESISLADGRVLPCGSAAVVELNGRRWPFPPEVLLPSAVATATMAGGEAVYVSIVQEDLPEVILRSIAYDLPLADPTPTGEVSLGLFGLPQPLRVKVDARTEIYLNGTAATLLDLRERDVCYAATSGDAPKRALRIYAYRQRVEGEVLELYRRYTDEDVRWEAEVFEQGREVRTIVFGEGCAEQVNVGLIGRRLTFCLNREDKVAYFADPGPAPGRPVVVKVVRLWELDRERRLTVDFRGEELTFGLVPGVAPVAGSLGIPVMAADQTVSAVQPVRPALFSAKVLGADATTGRLVLSSGQGDRSLNVSAIPLYLNDPAAGLTDCRLDAVSPGFEACLDDWSDPTYIIFVRTLP